MERKHRKRALEGWNKVWEDCRRRRQSPPEGYTPERIEEIERTTRELYALDVRDGLAGPRTAEEVRR